MLARAHFSLRNIKRPRTFPPGACHPHTHRPAMCGFFMEQRMNEQSSAQGGDALSREAFERAYAAKWKAATGKDQSVDELAAIVATMRDGDGYHNGHGDPTPYLSNLWEGWQMAAALSAPAQAVAVEPAPMVDCTPPATQRDKWFYEQGRLAERDPRTHPQPTAKGADMVLVPRKPTKAMLAAVPNAWPADALVTWDAMIAAHGADSAGDANA